MKRSVFKEAWDHTQGCMEWIGVGIYVVFMLLFQFAAACVALFIYCFALPISIMSRGADLALRQEDEL